ncbi:MAG: hypothetical protein MJB57_08745 [Gemmatimonadetes bacterium]|nr:hypothetical protein [Gemmatimonadota bacterium]
MKKFIHEIHRRSLWQVLGIYLGASWVVLQIVDTLAGALGLPDWSASFALFLLILGLPVVLATAFVQEGMSTKEAEARSQSLAEVDEAPPPPAPGLEGRHKLFTWKNALLGGAAAFALLGVLTAGYLFMRAAGIGPAGTLVAKGIVEESQPLVVAEFSSESGDVALAASASEALRIDLSQSPVVQVVERAEVGDGLERMGLERDERLTSDLAQDLAERDGIPALIDGQIDAVGSGYVLTARLVSTASGDVLVSRRETAADSTEIIGAIDALSKGLRERIGEPLRSLAGTTPLQDVATSSLRALRLYTQSEAAFVTADMARTTALLERTVEEDSAFAMAWRKLATIRVNQGTNLAAAYEAIERAYRYRTRLPDRDRYLTEATYHAMAWEYDQASLALETLLETEPDDGFALHNLGLYLEILGDAERATSLYERAYTHNSNPITLFYLARGLAAIGRTDEAERRLTEHRSRFPGNPFGTYLSAVFAVRAGEYERGTGEMREVLEAGSGGARWQATSQDFLGKVALMRGRLAEAARHFEDVSRAEESRVGENVIRAASSQVFLRAFATGDGSEGLSDIDDAVRRYPLESMHPFDRPYPELVAAYALAGELERARALLAEFDSAVPAGRRGGTRETVHFFGRGELALAEGRPDDALDAFESATRILRCSSCMLPRVAAAQEQLGDTDAAIETLEAWLAIPAEIGNYGVWTNGFPFFLAPAHEKLGQLYEARADLENARIHYAAFVDLWEGADEELQPRVSAARQRLLQMSSTDR